MTLDNESSARTPRRASALALSALLVSGGILAPALSAQAADVSFPVTQDFASGSAGQTFQSNDDWYTFGTTPLTYTGASAETSGSSSLGWLRLTEDRSTQSSALISTRSIPTNQGAVFEFDYRSYGEGTAEYGFGDGLSFFLTDGDDSGFVPSRAGSAGAGLGYTSACNNKGQGESGIQRGYLGVGFDAYGNFSAMGNLRATQPGVVGLGANAVVLRGSGDGGAVNAAGQCGVDYLYAAGATLPNGSLVQSGMTAQTATFRRAQVEVIPQPGSGPRITVSVSDATAVGQEPRGWAHNILDYRVKPGDGIFNTLPQNLRFGFAASTGGARMAQEIGNIKATTSADTALSVAGWYAPVGTDAARTGAASAGVSALDLGEVHPGDSVIYALTAANNGPAAINGGGTAGESRIFQDASSLGLTDLTWTCEASGSAVCGATGTQGGATLLQPWSGPSGSSVTVTVTGTVAEDAAEGDVRGEAILPTDFVNNRVDANSFFANDTGSVSESNPENNSVQVTATVSPVPVILVPEPTEEPTAEPTDEPTPSSPTTDAPATAAQSELAVTGSQADIPVAGGILLFAAGLALLAARNRRRAV